MASSKHNLQQKNNVQPTQREDMAASRFLALARENADVFWFLTPTGEMQEVSASWQSFTGQDESVALGRGWLDALHPADQPQLTEALAQAVSSSQATETEGHIRRHDGIYRSMRLQIIPVCTNDTQICDMVIFGKENTQKELGEQMSAAQIQLATEAAGVGIWDWDIITNQITWTEQSKELFGVSSDAPMNYEDFIATVHPTDSERVKEVIARALDEKTDYTTEFRIALPDGSTRWVAERGRGIYNTQGNPLHMVGATVDVSALKEVQLQKDLFLGVTTHELKTPLAALKGTFQLMERRLKRLRANVSDLAPEVSKFCDGLTQNLADSVHQINIQTRLINDLLDVSRITLNTLKLSQQECDLAAIVRKTVEDLHAVAPERSLQLAIPENITVKVFADPDRISQVLTNYVNNALCYADPDEPVHISLAVQGDMARVEVRDSGPGLTKEAQRRVWDLFYQSKEAPVQSSSGKGMGLGLYICQTLITQHQGAVGVECEPGVGCNFWFTLPILNTAANQTTTASPPAD